MSKANWPKIREREYRWQDKSGLTHAATSYQVNCRLLNGKRYQKTFKDKQDAEADAARLRAERDVELKNRTVSLTHLSDHERIDVLLARDKLAGRATLLQSAEFFVDHNILPTGPVLTVNEAIERYALQSQEDGLRDRSLEDLRGRLQKFADTFGKKPVTAISRSDAETWLRGLKKHRRKQYSPLSKQHFKVVVSGMFNWLIEKEYARLNPFARLSTSRRGKRLLRDTTLPGILKPDQVKKLFATAQAEVRSMIAPLALSFFAGLRTNEIRGARWEDINFETKLITVRPEVAKRRRARHIEMEANLIEWLMLCRQETGPIAPGGQGYRIGLDRVRTKAGFAKGFTDYPKNAGRHTFATMAVQKYQDAAKVALMLGHTTTGLLFDHYKSLATPKEAEQYWNIKPGQKDNIVSIPATA